MPNTVARLVKQTAADTTLQNAKRDGAQFAWIPHGDTCSFCITLASRGWQYMSKNALKNGHAEHIHANCDCEYGVRFDGKSNVAGYDPDKYLEQYNNAEGTKPRDKINSMHREQYAKDADKINSRKRELYAERRILQEKQINDSISGAIQGALDPDSDRALEHADRYYESVRHMKKDVKRIASNTGFSEEDIQAIKEFIFEDEHDLATGRKRFDSSFEMAQSWQRLIDGENIQEHDFTMLKHELRERELMLNGKTQDEAHRIASTEFNYAKEAKEFYDKTNKNREE